MNKITCTLLILYSLCFNVKAQKKDDAVLCIPYENFIYSNYLQDTSTSLGLFYKNRPLAYSIKQSKKNNSYPKKYIEAPIKRFNENRPLIIFFNTRGYFKINFSDKRIFTKNNCKYCKCGKIKTSYCFKPIQEIKKYFQDNSDLKVYRLKISDILLRYLKENNCNLYINQDKISNKETLVNNSILLNYYIDIKKPIKVELTGNSFIDNKEININLDNPINGFYYYLNDTSLYDIWEGKFNLKISLESENLLQAIQRGEIKITTEGLKPIKFSIEDKNLFIDKISPKDGEIRFCIYNNIVSSYDTLKYKLSDIRTGLDSLLLNEKQLTSFVDYEALLKLNRRGFSFSNIQEDIYHNHQKYVMVINDSLETKLITKLDYPFTVFSKDTSFLIDKDYKFQIKEIGTQNLSERFSISKEELMQKNDSQSYMNISGTSLFLKKKEKCAVYINFTNKDLIQLFSGADFIIDTNVFSSSQIKVIRNKFQIGEFYPMSTSILFSVKNADKNFIINDKQIKIPIISNEITLNENNLKEILNCNYKIHFNLVEPYNKALQSCEIWINNSKVFIDKHNTSSSFVLTNPDFSFKIKSNNQFFKSYESHYNISEWTETNLLNNLLIFNDKRLFEFIIKNVELILNFDKYSIEQWNNRNFILNQYNRKTYIKESELIDLKKQIFSTFNNNFYDILEKKGNRKCQIMVSRKTKEYKFVCENSELIPDSITFSDNKFRETKPFRNNIKLWKTENDRFSYILHFTANKGMGLICKECTYNKKNIQYKGEFLSVENQIDLSIDFQKLPEIPFYYFDGIKGRNNELIRTEIDNLIKLKEQKTIPDFCVCIYYKPGVYVTIFSWDNGFKEKINDQFKPTHSFINLGNNSSYYADKPSTVKKNISKIIEQVHDKYYLNKVKNVLYLTEMTSVVMRKEYSVNNNLVKPIIKQY